MLFVDRGASVQTCGNCPFDCGPCQNSTDVTDCAEKNVYALTFDDGPSIFTPRLLAMLPTYNIPVSFFIIGNNLNAFPCMMDQEYEMGFTTLSHTFTHPDLTTLTMQQIYDEFAQTTVAFANSGTCRRPTLYRPPYGNTNAAIARTCVLCCLSVA